MKRPGSKINQQTLSLEQRILHTSEYCECAVTKGGIDSEKQNVMVIAYVLIVFHIFVNWKSYT